MKITRVFILTLSMLAAIGAQAGLDSRSFMQRFAEIEQYASHQDALAAVDSLMTEVQLQNSKEFTYLRAIDVAEEHLCNAVDSLFDIDIYAQVLHHATTSGALSGDVLVRPQIMLEMLSKNRVGTQAADI
ncbi:MAG: hypothetical protein IK092_01110, partial [Muribaculaceae bacterium]|nr:hypothetical protein [Muribaculaceae bacterium]